MSIIEIIVIAIGVSMDAFAVAICKGLSVSNRNISQSIKDKNKYNSKITKNYGDYIIIGLYFGLFQAIMPIIGYMLGVRFQQVVENVDHWFAFILLSGIGANMIKEAFQIEHESLNDKTDFKTMIGLAIATSIDALAIGVTFAILRINIFTTSLIIGLITFVISVIGVQIGSKVGNKYGKKAEAFGGIVLIIIGIKTLISHLIY